MSQLRRAWQHIGAVADTPATAASEHLDDIDDPSSPTLSYPQPPIVSRAHSEPEKVASRSLNSRRKSDLQRIGTNANSLFTGPRNQNAAQSGGQSSDPLGLRLVHDVPDPHGDIILVHGLGGNAYRTWCWNRDEENFWPAWLHHEEGLESYRVFTFGYNSNFRGASTNLNVIDFAKSLLSQMLISDGNLGPQSTSIGNQPIIFIAHSMGGLVAKKAYVLGKSDNTFTDIINKIHGIIFLATPHRGASNVKLLNHILSSAPTGAGPKAYISDLDRDSGTLQDINEQFSTVCGDLALMSFFETFKTSLGMHKVHIVDKSSGVLGYPQERSDSLDADHHNICKFKDRKDRNYLSVKNTIRLWATKISPARPSLQSIKRRVSNSLDTLKKIQSITGVRENADDELKINRKRILDGTCTWLTDTEFFKQWVNEIPTTAASTTFHLVGQPATGKTLIATHVIDHLKSLDEQCQYHFFSNGHQNKKTVAYCLRSIVTQLALVNETFRKKLFNLHGDTGLIFSSQDQNFGAIWDQIFEGIIFKMEFQRPLCWVFDGIDEADGPHVLINSLFKMEPLSPIRLFFSSRPLKLPGSQMNGPMVTTYPLTVQKTAMDIRHYVQDTVRDFLPDDAEIQNDLVDRILIKAEGSFLWVRLALETLHSNWHTLDDIRDSLEEVPQGMEPMYARMLDLVNAQPKRQQAMAKTILTWAVCSWRPLSVSELKLALQPEFSGFIKLQDTIIQICGHFISIDSERITFIHATARKFLLDNKPGMPAFIDEELGHEHIAIACLSHLSNDSWKRVFKAVQSRKEMSVTSRPNLLVVAEKENHFLGYSTCYWAYHVSKATLNSTKLLNALDHFLKYYCLSWIEGIALSKNLRYLTRSAQFLKVFAKRQKRLSKSNSPMGSRQLANNDKAQDIKLWAIDFIRIVGKFGHNLIQSPSAIHRLVPPFCPRDSMIGQTYGTSLDKPFSVNGLPFKGWDDSLASVSVGDGKYVMQVLATDSFFITLRSGVRGPIDTYFADTCALARTLHHGEYIRRARLNKARTVLATAGAEHYQIWDVVTGEVLYHKPNETRALPLAITFGTSDVELVVALDDCTIRCYDLREVEEKWCFSPSTVRDDFRDPPKIVNFSPDLSKVAIAWRGKPPVVFDIVSGGSRYSRYWVLDNNPALWAADRIKWKQDSSSVLILCENTKLIEWHVYDEEQTVHEDVKAREMTVSRDGDLLLTSDSAGNISVWTFPMLQLIYRLENENEFVRNITLSPDAQRVYRTTDNKTTVLEPDALVRPDAQELEDQAITAGFALAQEPVIIHNDFDQNRVTSLAYGFADTFYCAGRDDGTVRIHDIFDGKMICTVSRHDSTSSIIALHWSYSNKYIISGDDAGHLLAQHLEYKKKRGSFKISSVFDVRFRFPIHQLILNHDEKLLLISTSNSDEVWNLETKEKLSHKDWEERQDRQWMQHPFEEERLVWIGPGVVRFYDWRTLEQTEAIETEPHNPTANVGHSTHGNKILWVALTSNKQYVIYLAGSGHPSTRLSSGLHLEFLSTSNFQVQHPSTLPDDCMADLASQIVRLIGTYQDRIVFLDHDYWLCTWRIDAGVNEVKRHFFLPKDWGSPSTLEMAALNDQGTFFCPKRGNVAIVRHGMRF